MDFIYQTPYGEATISFSGMSEPSYRGQPTRHEAIAQFDGLTVNRIQVRGWVNYAQTPEGWRLTNSYIRREPYGDDLSWNLRAKVQDALLAGLEQHATPDTLTRAEGESLIRAADSKTAEAVNLRKQADALDAEAATLREKATSL